MTPGVLISAGLLALAWFGAVNVVLSGVSYVASLAVSATIAADPRRARRLLALRLVPATGSTVVAALLFFPMHLWLEPANANERIGLVPMAFAALGLLAFARSAWRIVSVALASVRLTSMTPAAGTGLTPWTELPMLRGIALAGVFRPRVLVGSIVRKALTPAELEVALAHEAAHQRAGDNLARAAMHCAPDLFGFTRAARRIEQLWEAESECLADAWATRGQPARGARLASALIKVARLASETSEPRCAEAWSTFHQPVLLETRIRLLVADRSLTVVSGRPLLWVAGALALAVVTAWIAGVPHDLHSVTEAVIASVF